MKTWIGALMLACAATSTQAATVWDEGVNGDFSGDGLSPTPLTMSAGHNVVLGTTGNPGTGVDRDYFSFSIPAGSVLTELWLLPNTSVSGGSSFFGIQAGPQFTVTHSGGGIENFYGFNHYDNSHVGSDILVMMVGAAKAPIPAGSYSVWIQETGGPASYGLDFVITQVPEPATAVSLALGVGLLGCRRFVLQRR